MSATRMISADTPRITRTYSGVAACRPPADRTYICRVPVGTCRSAAPIDLKSLCMDFIIDLYSLKRYQLCTNEMAQHTAKPSQMTALPRLSTSATNAGQANTTTDVAYLS